MLRAQLPAYGKTKIYLLLAYKYFVCKYFAYLPKQKHQGLQEGTEIIVPIDGGLVIQRNVSKYLPQRAEVLQGKHSFM